MFSGVKNIRLRDFSMHQCAPPPCSRCVSVENGTCQKTNWFPTKMRTTFAEILSCLRELLRDIEAHFVEEMFRERSVRFLDRQSLTRHFCFLVVSALFWFWCRPSLSFVTGFTTCIFIRRFFFSVLFCLVKKIKMSTTTAIILKRDRMVRSSFHFFLLLPNAQKGSVQHRRYTSVKYIHPTLPDSDEINALYDI